jgi:hypothetical protein
MDSMLRHTDLTLCKRSHYQKQFPTREACPYCQHNEALDWLEGAVAFTRGLARASGNAEAEAIAEDMKKLWHRLAAVRYFTPGK